MPDGKAEDDLLSALWMSATAACIAEATTLPFDTAKVRLQLQNVAASRSGVALHKYRGSLQTIATLLREEGLTSPFKGLVPGLHRQFLFTGLRLGLYERVRAAFSGNSEDPGLVSRIAAALTTSAIGISVANPSDVVKVRLQACQVPRSFSGVPAAAGAPVPAYASAAQAYASILSKEGLLGGLYRGYGANVVRNSIISATEIVSYDYAKHGLLHAGMPDGLPLHITAGMSAGLAATVLGSPWDVIGTRLMAETGAGGSGAPALFPFIARMLREEGFAAFYKGFIPNFARIGSFNLVLWSSYEAIKSAFAPSSAGI